MSCLHLLSFVTRAVLNAGERSDGEGDGVRGRSGGRDKGRGNEKDMKEEEGGEGRERRYGEMVWRRTQKRG